MATDRQEETRLAESARFRQYHADGNLLGCIVILSRTPDAAAEAGGADAVLTSFERPGVAAELVRQCAKFDSTINSAYQQALARARSTHQTAAGRAPESFVQCIAFKNLLRDGLHPIVHNMATIMGDHFGRRSAAGYFGGPYPTTRISDATVHFTLDGADVGFAAGNADLRQALALFFLHEPGILRWISRFGAEDVFLDVGANLGKYTIVAAKVRGCRTAAIEPFSINFDALQENIRLNGLEGRVSAHRLAIWDRTTEGRLSFQTETVGAAAQGFMDPKSPLEDRNADDHFEEVRAARLDDLIADGTLPSPTHIKIDVDGEEWRLIDGMPHTLAGAGLKSIRIEMRDSAENRRAVAALQNAGFVGAVDDDAKNLLFVRG